MQRSTENQSLEQVFISACGLLCFLASLYELLTQHAKKAWFWGEKADQDTYIFFNFWNRKQRDDMMQDYQNIASMFTDRITISLGFYFSCMC